MGRGEEGDDLFKWVNGYKQKKAFSLEQFLNLGVFLRKKNIQSPLRMTYL